MKGNQITTKLCENLKSNKKYHNISISIVFHIKMSWEEGPTHEKLQWIPVHLSQQIRPTLNDVALDKQILLIIINVIACNNNSITTIYK